MSELSVSEETNSQEPVIPVKEKKSLKLPMVLLSIVLILALGTTGYLIY